jgi:hypothetical protein
VLSDLVAELGLPVRVGGEEPDSPGEGAACCFVSEDLSAVGNEDEMGRRTLQPRKLTSDQPTPRH